MNTALKNNSGNQASLDTAFLPLLLSAAAAAALIGVSRAHLYALHSSGRLGPLPIQLGKSSRWRRDELESWVASDCPSRQQWQARRDADPR